jgi:hypothetical protein
MKERASDQECGYAGDALSYIYRELDAADRDGFELHLESCGRCVDELAELSYGHLAVYEWNRDDFVPLPTPLFANPAARQASIWTTIANGFRTALSPQFAAAALAALVLASLTAVWIYTGSAAPDTSDLVLDASPPAVAPVAEAVRREVIDIQPQSETPLALKNASTRVRVQPARRAASRTAAVTERRDAPARGTEPSRALRLNDFPDEDDTTLRLGDLFADADTR